MTTCDNQCIHRIVTVYTAFRCPTDLLKAIKAKAKTQRRSLSNYIVCVIDKDVNVKKGGRDAAP